MRKRIFAAFICLCMIMSLVPSMAFAGDTNGTVYTGGLCEHHQQHDESCGYSEGTAEVPCNHEHTEECYTVVTNCIHEHTEECYSEGSTEPDLCSHVCSEETGCIVKELDCKHVHDENCGYVPATEGTPCSYVCEICNPPVTEEQKCICDTKCTEGAINENCPVCGGEDGDMTLCVGEEAVTEAECICGIKCTEGAINENCPICGEGGNIDGCIGAAPAMLFSPMSTRSITPAQPSGDGTEENPYKIGTAEELYWFAGMVNGTLTDDTAQNTGAWAELTANITIPEGETWTAIGNYESISYDNDDPKFPVFQIVSYTGTFDGKGYTISNLYSYEEYGSRSGGLFGYIGAGGTVKNVGILDSVIDHLTASSSRYRIIDEQVSAGGICGYNNGTIENCYSTAEVINRNKNNSLDKVGGVCGYNDGTVKNCYNTGSVSSDGTSYIGGVCGYNNGMIINCYNTGEVSDASINLSYVGGICGYNNSTIENCYNTGEASNSTSNPSYVGSACGYNHGTMTNCYFLTGTAENDIASDDGTTTNVEEKDESAFSSGEVAWLLDKGQSPHQWAQMLGTEDFPRLVMEPGDEKYAVVQVTVNFPDSITQEPKASYTNINQVLKDYPVMVGNIVYEFYEDIAYKNLINILEKTYNSDTDIYANTGTAITSIDLEDMVLTAGGSDTLNADVNPENASYKDYIIWESSNTEVATVDSSGKVKALKAGTATITATAIDGSGVKGECTVEVIQQVTDITLNKTELSLYTDREEKLTATIEPDNANDKSLNWSSSAPEVATVDENGTVKAISQGEAIITAEAADGSGKSAQCTVKVIQQVTDITLNKTELSLYTDREEKLTATIEPDNANDKSLNWSSSAPEVATVDENGTVKAISQGEAIITAEAADGQGAKAQCTVEVIQQVTDITLNKTELSLYIGREEKLTATIEPDNANDKSLNWSSSAPEVATVDENGTVKAISQGEAIITAEAADGQGAKAECTVTVRKRSSSGGGSPSYHSITFNTNGGDDMDQLIESEYTDIDIDEYIPEKEGYKFMGWYLDEDFEEKAEDITLSDNITLYAKWEKIEEEETEDDIEETEETEQAEETIKETFEDVAENDWYFDSVNYVVEKGIMSGMGDGIFKPNMPFTREMLSVVLYNIEGRPESTGISAFSDVQSGMWYTDAIIWANKNDIVVGYGDGTYGVGDIITREQFAAILYRYAAFKGYDVSVGENTNILSYTDAFDISDYAFSAMQWACGTSIINGMGDGTIAPQGKATRAEAATMLMNFYKNVVE